MAVVGIAVLLQQYALAVVIDDFSDGSIELRRIIGDPIGMAAWGLLDRDHVLGEMRTFKFRAYSPTGALGGTTIAVHADSGKLKYESDPGVTAANLEFSYGPPFQPLFADFTVGGADRLRFQFDFTDFETPAAFDVRVRTISYSEVVTWTAIASLQLPNSAVPFSVDLPFSKLQEAQPYLMDFSQVIEFSFGSSNGSLLGEFVLDSITTVPEPATIAIAILAACSVCCVRKRSLAPGTNQ